MQTREGPTITAGHVVLATGYELSDRVPASTHQVISTWAIATKPQPRAIWPQAALDLGSVRPVSLHARHG